MKAPGDGDDGPIDDGLIAEVIPLRRRGPGDTWERPREPPPCDVFEPPRDPEPLGEYSVWEMPASELIRREPPARQRRTIGARFTPPHGSPRSRWLAIGVLVAAGLGMIALTAPLGRQHSPTAVGQVSSPAGLGQTLGAGGTSAPPRTRGGHLAPARRATSHTTADGTRGRHSVSAPTRGPSRVVSYTTTNANVSYSPSSAGTQGASGAGAPIATAAREFGFER